MAVAIRIPDVQTVSPIDALWTIIQGQSKSVQKALLARLEQLYPSKVKETSQQKYVRETLTKAIKETKQTLDNGEKMPSAYELLNEL